MKERPILFSAPMIRAILAGLKTQTRRVVKPQPEPGTDCPYHVGIGADRKARVCPYGAPGDRLWVRETGWERPVRTPQMMRNGADTWPRYVYDADGFSEQEHADLKEWGFVRRPSIHMPRWASRITLEVVGVRVERLLDISRGDAMDEGCPFPNMAAGDDPRQWYADLWQQINGPGSWALNPWVWVVEFRRA